MEENKASANKIDVRNIRLLIQYEELKKIMYKYAVFSDGPGDINCASEDCDTILDRAKESHIMYLKINQNTCTSMIDQIIEEFFLDINLKNTNQAIWMNFKYMNNSNKDFSMLPLCSYIAEQIIDAADVDTDIIFSTQENDTCDTSEVWEMDMIVIVVYK